MSKEYLERMFSLVRQAGVISTELIEQSSPSLKQDNSVVTKADHAISKLTHQHLDDLLRSKEHILIDEEDPNNTRYLDQGLLERTPFVWSIDPIDGTRLYANRMPHYGISIGLLKDREPYMGVVYFPELRELFYCDGTHSYFIRNAFSEHEKKQMVTPIDQEISGQTVFFCHDSFFEEFRWDNSKCRIMILACAVVDMCWPAVGRGCGSILQPAIWDCAGSWPIARSAGLEMRSLSTGKVLKRLDVEFVQNRQKPWEFKEVFLLSSERNYRIIKENIDLL